MGRSSLRLSTIILAAGDAAAALAALAVAILVRYGGAPDPVVVRLWEFAAPFLVVLWLAGLFVFGLYDLKLARNEPAFFERLARALALDFALTVLLFYLIPGFSLRPIASLIVIFALLALALAGWRQAFNALLARRAKERVLFYGFSPEAAALAGMIGQHPQLGYEAVGFVAENRGGHGALPVFSVQDDLAAIVRAEHVSLIVTSPDIKRSRAVVHAFFRVVPLGAAIVDFERFYEAVEGKVPASLIGEGWFLENLVGSRRPRYEFAKRVLDLAMAMPIGLTALLLLPAAAAAIVLSTPWDVFNVKTRRARPGDGIIFFRQPRVGRGGRIFDFIKLRSQVLGAELMGAEKTGGPDPRAYPVGTFLRRTYLDELPQVWNVIKGQMSFVGPRPERPEFMAELERRVPFYRTRELVTPGITGWAQINMENDASVSDAPQKLCYDLYYIKNRSLALDLAILLKTALTLMRRSGR